MAFSTQNFRKSWRGHGHGHQVFRKTWRGHGHGHGISRKTWRGLGHGHGVKPVSTELWFSFIQGARNSVDWYIITRYNTVRFHQNFIYTQPGGQK